MISEIFNYTISTMLILVEFISFYNLNKAFFKHKKNSVLYFGLGIIAAVVFSNMVLLDDSTKMLITVVVLTLISKLAFESDWKLVTILSVVQVVLIFAFDYLVSFVLMMIFNISSIDIVNNYTTFFAVSFTSKLALYISVYIFCRIIESKNKQRNISIVQWLEIVLFSLCSLFNLYLIVDYSLKTDLVSIVLIFSTVFIIACNITIFIIIQRIEDENEWKKAQAVLKEQIKIQTEKYETLATNYQSQRKLTHDFNSHMEIINGLSIKNDIQEIFNYSKGVLNNSKAESMILNSNHPIVDVLINNKYQIAKEKGIKMMISSSDISQIPIKNEEAVVILSNLLDNAIEACEQVSKDKIIKIKLTKENIHYIISVHNKTKNKAGFNEDNIISSKKDKFNHGYGIKNVLSILRKYNSFYLIEHKDYWFKFTIML